MEYEEDFVNEDLIEFDVDGKKFKYKPTTAENELDWAPEYLEVVDGITRQNLKKVTLCKVRNLKEVPYTKELINKIIKVEKGWMDLSDKEKSMFMGKLAPGAFDKIIRNINKIDSPDSEQKKN